jgi:hypothetical protein
MSSNRSLLQHSARGSAIVRLRIRCKISKKTKIHHKNCQSSSPGSLPSACLPRLTTPPSSFPRRQRSPDGASSITHARQICGDRASLRRAARPGALEERSRFDYYYVITKVSFITSCRGACGVPVVCLLCVFCMPVVCLWCLRYLWVLVSPSGNYVRCF